MSLRYLILALIPACILFLPFWFRKEKGIPLALTFASVLYFVYQVWVPISDRFWGFDSFFGYTFRADHWLDQEISLIYGLSFLAMGLGYRFLPFRLPRIQVKELLPTKRFEILTALQLLLWALVLWNVHASGIPLNGVFDPKNRNEESILFSVFWAYPFIDLLSNAFPVCLYLQGKSAQGKQWWLFSALLAFWLLFALLGGWRYRILLFVLFWMLDLLRAGIWRKVWFWPALVAVGLSLALLTLNRMALAKRQFDVLTLDLRQFTPELFNQEFSNARTFRATLEHMEDQQLSHPGTEAWLPLFRQKFSDAPPQKPWILEVTKAWVPPGWPWNPNPAVCQNEEMFLTFGVGGLLVFMFLFGGWLKALDCIGSGFLPQAFQVVAIGLLFQWISRGFFLFQLQISLVCLLPFVVLIGLGSYLSRGSKRNPA